MAVAAPAAAGAAGGAAGGGAAGGGAARGGAGAGKAGSGGIKPDQALRAGGQGGGDDEERERRKRHLRILLASPIAFCLFVLLFFCVVLLSVFSAARTQAEASTTTDSYPSGSGIPPVYWPMYVSAATHYKVNPYLLASIHYQETRFSTAESSHSGVNSNGCCAGPMQFNIEAGSWKEYEAAFRPIEGERPESHYPSDRRDLPSCADVPKTEGCVYDDFDAIAAAAELLHHNRADTDLDSEGTRLAVCSYIGSCAEVDGCTGSENQYCEVLPRALSWQAEASAAPSGPLRERIVEVAAGELAKGIHEGAGNCNPYGPCEEWCAMFSTWVWERAGIHIRTAMSHEGLNPYYVPELETYAKRNGLWRSTPAPGDMIVWNSHVGLVKAVSGGQIAEIGGNQSDAVTELNGSPADLGEGPPNGYISPPEGDRT